MSEGPFSSPHGPCRQLPSKLKSLGFGQSRFGNAFHHTSHYQARAIRSKSSPLRTTPCRCGLSTSIAIARCCWRFRLGSHRYFISFIKLIRKCLLDSGSFAHPADAGMAQEPVLLSWVWFFRCGPFLSAANCLPPTTNCSVHPHQPSKQ